LDGVGCSAMGKAARRLLAVPMGNDLGIGEEHTTRRAEGGEGKPGSHPMTVKVRLLVAPTAGRVVK
jgi:hypothetical protein